MAIKSIQMYRKNLDGTETRLNPLTEAQYVSMENGQTVQEVLSDRDSDKYTPVITNSSSTFKVGQGDNVDLSSSMKEGAYDSCVLKGKTMVNCIQEPSSKDVVLPYAFEDGQYVTINDTKESGALGVELKGQTLVNLVPSSVVVSGGRKLHKDDGSGQIVYTYKPKVPLKPNTVYTCFVWLKDVVNPNSVPLNCSMSNRDFYARPMTNGLNIAVGTTKSELGGENCNIRIGNADVIAGARGVLLDAVVVEGDYSSIEINPFYGMTSCKMPTLHTVGKNLITQSFINTLCNLDNWEGTGAYRNNRKAGELLALFPSNSYVTQVPALTIPANFYPIIYLSYQDESSVSNGYILASGLYNNNTDSEMVCPERQWRFSVNSKNVVVRGYVNKWNQENMNKLKTVMTQNIQMETGTTTTTYEQGKSSILSLPEEVVLRSLPNGVCDTFNTQTGVYTQRIEEVVLNGSENWAMYALDENFPDVAGFYHTHRGGKIASGVVNQNYIGSLPVFAQEKFPGKLTVNEEGVGLSDSRYVKISILKSKLSSIDSNGLKQWLQSNPMTIQYELADPVVTKINLSSTLKSWNTTTHIYSEIPENTLYPILSHSNPTYPVILKPSTKYSIVANSYSNSHTNSAVGFNLGGATASTTVGNRVTTITTPSTLSNELLTMSGRGNKLNNVMVIEGDVAGDESYFEGICDCKSPILSNIGKNLLDVDDLIKKHSHSSVVEITKTDTGFNMKSKNAGTWNATNYSMQLKPNTQYIFNCIANTKSNTGSIKLWNDCELFHVYRDVLLQNTTNLEINITFTTQKDGVVKFQLNTTRDISALGDIEVLNVSLYELTNQTTYEPYKSNTTTFDQKDGKTIVLRSLPNGVCDTLNVETGEYVQRIGQNTFDGSENWTLMRDNENENILFSCTGFNSYINVSGAPSMLCDKIIPKAPWTYTYSQTSSNGIVLMDTRKGCRIGLIRSEGVTNVDEFKTWLAKNPTTIQYELETPIVSTIDVQGFPYAYTNGHVQLSSGSIEQSLTPKVEYSLSANKTGQINSNTKRVSAHQKQLDDFEAMMLTSMVQSAYDKAILQFDYEMQMMSLGGE